MISSNGTSTLKKSSLLNRLYCLKTGYSYASYLEVLDASHDNVLSLQDINCLNFLSVSSKKLVSWIQLSLCFCRDNCCMDKAFFLHEKTRFYTLGWRSTFKIAEQSSAINSLQFMKTTRWKMRNRYFLEVFSNQISRSEINFASSTYEVKHAGSGFFFPLLNYTNFTFKRGRGCFHF